MIFKLAVSGPALCRLGISSVWSNVSNSLGRVNKVLFTVRINKIIKNYFLTPSSAHEKVSHHEWPIDAAHLGVQLEQVQDEEDEEDHEEPQCHHLKELERRPTGPPSSTMGAQEGDEQGHLEKQNIKSHQFLIRNTFYLHFIYSLIRFYIF